jgi:hypothetical protein
MASPQLQFGHPSAGAMADILTAIKHLQNLCQGQLQNCFMASPQLQFCHPSAGALANFLTAIKHV